jgi:predicted nucleic acid-binding protein
MTYFIDSNIFLRVVVKESEESFRECRDFLEAVKRNQIDAVTANLILAEIVWVAGSYYKLDRSEIVRIIRGIVSLPGLKIVDGVDAERATGNFEAKRVKYIDAALASIPELAGRKWAIVSYDRDFDRLGLKRLEPDMVNKEILVGVKVH